MQVCEHSKLQQVKTAQATDCGFMRCFWPSQPRGQPAETPPALRLGHCWQRDILPLLNIVDLGCLACTCSAFRKLVHEPGSVDWQAKAVAHAKGLSKFQALRISSPEQAKYLLCELACARHIMHAGYCFPMSSDESDGNGLQGHEFIVLFGNLGFLWCQPALKTLKFGVIPILCLRNLTGTFELIGRLWLRQGAISGDMTDLLSVKISKNRSFSNSAISAYISDFSCEEGDICQSAISVGMRNLPRANGHPTIQTCARAAMQKCYAAFRRMSTCCFAWISPVFS